MNMDRWMREVSIPLVAEEVEALLNGVIAGESFKPGIGKGGSQDPQATMDTANPDDTAGRSNPYQVSAPTSGGSKLCAPDCKDPHPWHGGKAKLDGGKNEPRDAAGRWSKSGAPGSQHGSKKNMIRKNLASHAAYATHILEIPHGDLDASLVRAAQKIKDHHQGGVEAITPHEANLWHAHVEGRINHEGAITDYSEASHRPPESGIKIRPYKDRNKPWPNLHEAAEEIAALLTAGPHDVSGEARDKGKFAKTPGAGAKPEPTGSPLDPATGVKPPPEPHEIHAQIQKYHEQASKAALKQIQTELKLGSYATSPEDRQQHIENAKKMKQLATQHSAKASEAAQKVSEALSKKAASAAASGVAPVAPGTVMPDQPWGTPPSAKGYTPPTMPRDTHTTGQGIKPLPKDVTDAALKPAAKDQQARGKGPFASPMMPQTGTTGTSTGKPVNHQQQLQQEHDNWMKQQLRPRAPGTPVDDDPSSSYDERPPAFAKPRPKPTGPAIVPPDTSTGEGRLPAASQQPGAQMRPPGTGGYKGKPGGPLQRKMAQRPANFPKPAPTQPNPHKPVDPKPGRDA